MHWIKYLFVCVPLVTAACATTALPTPSPSPDLGNSPTPTTSASPASTQVPGPNGGLSLRISGNHFVDGNGHTTRLLGVNRAGTEYGCVQGWGLFDGPSDAASVAVMASWHINTVRVPLNEDCWLGINGVKPALAGGTYRSAIHAYVDTLHAAGLFVVLDLHWNNPGTTPANGLQVMADQDHAPAFWSSVATSFKSDPAVVFDLYNEPHDIDWNCWLRGCTAPGWRTAGMQSLVDAVRATGASQPLLLDGNDWANDVSQWLQNKPHDPLHQLAAGVHTYNFNRCNGQSCWDGTIKPIALTIPVVTGELGQNGCAHDYIDRYMAWADAHGVSYLAWTWDTWNCSSGPSLISAYDGTATAFGAGFRDHLATVRP